jgi:hypothetical protein
VSHPAAIARETGIPWLARSNMALFEASSKRRSFCFRSERSKLANDLLVMRCLLRQKCFDPLWPNVAFSKAFRLVTERAFASGLRHGAKVSDSTKVPEIPKVGPVGNGPEIPPEFSLSLELLRSHEGFCLFKLFDIGGGQ